MQIESIHIENQSSLMKYYRDRDPRIMKYFDYSGSELEFEERINELGSRGFQRNELANILTELNQEWNAPTSTLSNIERLRDHSSLVVIGGQQAGVLTGPLYSINKVISIIQLAKSQNSKLDQPVIPVFWIAGEDHDFEEINHIFMHNERRLKKYTVNQRITKKWPVSNIPIDRSDLDKWLDELFNLLHETMYTKDLYTLVKQCLESSETYVDFFARLIFALFPEEGIVLMDSQDVRVRRLESEYFLDLIENQENISGEVYKTLQQLNQEGLSIPLDVSPIDANLFYHKDGERVLLVRNDDGEWVGKQNEVNLSSEEIIGIAKNQPELLSNNVVTRPIMQDLLFPTLAFVGGPGEISYWSVLKPAFHHLGIKMPPVVPRLSFTFIERKTEKLLTKYNIQVTDAVNHGVEVQKVNWLMNQNNPPVPAIASELKNLIEEAHRPLREIAANIQADLGNIADKNLVYLQRNIDYLEARIKKALEEKYDKELSEFDLINNSLRPMGGLQERKWNPLPFVNKYGFAFMNELCKEECSFENEHYIVYMD